ncbi:MAG TPA: MFS transporter [Blastocatellia bacterium]|nr:MFS transporter [Blastocatellia bacterium]
MQKPRLSFWQIWNMSFGFLGIQFGWGLQLANMSAIYTYLGADPDRIPILWLAGPMTGLIVQPIIGSMSDRTWNRLGRRRPYFLVGAILSSVALFFMPDSTALWIAASLLWILDASINISMEPFRAFVADKLNVDQRTAGFVMQSFFIGIGATLANGLPFCFRLLGVTGRTASGIPLTVQYSFKIGAAAFLSCVLWTIFTSKEYPPDDLEEFRRKQAETRGTGSILEKLINVVRELLREIGGALREMPQTMKQLAVVQVFTWLGLFCMWMFFGLMTSRHVFGAIESSSVRFAEGGEWGGICFAVYSIVCFVVAFLLPKTAAATSRKTVHAISLTCGGVGLLSTYLIHDQYVLLLTMVGVGIAWASILSMPYAILSGALPPARMGVYMGIFNFFIVIPEIVASLTFQPLVRYVFGNNPLYVVMLGGASLLVAAALVARVRDVADRISPEAVIAADEYEPFTVPEAIQPVPSTGLIDD